MTFLKKAKEISINITGKGFKFISPKIKVLLSIINKFLLKIDNKLSKIDNDKFQRFYIRFKKITKHKYFNLILLTLSLIVFCSTSIMVNSNKIITTEILEKKIIVHRGLKENDNIIKIYDHRNKKVIEMSLEEYLYGVVAGEISSDFEEEAIKAQSIAARTFTSNIIMNKTKKHSSGAHICTDYKHCQEYKPSKITDKIKKSVNATKGQIATYDNKPINALYYAISSGKTENAKDVWNSTYPYLLSVDSPYDKDVKGFNSTVKTTKDKLVEILNVTFNEETPLEEQIKIVSRTEGGSVNKIKIGSATFSGTNIRSRLALRSANFTLSFNGDNIIFNVKGFGHGVGMSQHGANGMAKKGFKYEDILKHYYTNIELVNLY